MISEPYDSAAKRTTVNEGRISEIQQGLCVLVGIGTDDVSTDVDYIVNKILSLRLFPSEGNENISKDHTEAPKLDHLATEPTPKSKQWSRNVKEIFGEVLCVSQFTLMAKTKKGSKPDFHNAMGTEASREMYSHFLRQMKLSYLPERIRDGEFGAMMKVQIINDGPVTIMLDSKEGRRGS